MFKTSTEQIVQEFATTNENWKANTNLSDSIKIRLLSVAEETPERGFVGRILNKKTAFIHGTTFMELEENKNTSEFEVSKIYFMSSLSLLSVNLCILAFWYIYERRNISF